MRDYRVIENAEELLRQRVVLLCGPLDDQQATEVIAKLLFLQYEDPRQPITVLIDSPGGSVTAGMAIIDTMGTLSPPVRTRCDGIADGMAAVILASGQCGERVVVRGSSLSLTPVTVGVEGKQVALERTRELLAEVLADRLNRGTKSIAQDMAAGRSFDPPAAVEYGLADRVEE
jgi:ATP-dependent Clp protease protease subunit